MLGDGPLDIAMTMDIVELLLSRGAVQTKPFNTVSHVKLLLLYTYKILKASAVSIGMVCQNYYS